MADMSKASPKDNLLVFIFTLQEITFPFSSTHFHIFMINGLINEFSRFSFSSLCSPHIDCRLSSPLPLTL